MDNGDKYIVLYLKLLFEFIPQGGMLGKSIKKISGEIGCKYLFLKECIEVFCLFGLVRYERGIGYVLTDCEKRCVVVERIHPRDRNSNDYRFWRTSVFVRDQYVCQKCGRVGNKLEAHHISPWAVDVERRFDVDNGITLCVDCHRLEHKRMRGKNNG